MEDLIIMLIKGEKITDEVIKEALYEICDREHSRCNDDCPVYKLNNHNVVDTTNDNKGCECFKDGTSMLNFIREKLKMN